MSSASTLQPKQSDENTFALQTARTVLRTGLGQSDVWFGLWLYFCPVETKNLCLWRTSASLIRTAKQSLTQPTASAKVNLSHVQESKFFADA